MLKRENELRLSEDVQRRFEEAEKSGSNTDWIEVASQVQHEVLREYNVSENALHAYRCAANKYGVSLYVKYNRAREGDLGVGSQAPDVPIVSLDNAGKTCSQSLLQLQTENQPLVIVAGSLVSSSCWLGPTSLLPSFIIINAHCCHFFLRADPQHGISCQRYTVTLLELESSVRILILHSCTPKRHTPQMNGL